MSTATIRKVDQNTPSVSNDLATRDAFAAIVDAKDRVASRAFVSEAEWADVLTREGGPKAYALKLDKAAKGYATKGSQVRLAMVLTAARMFAADPAKYSKGKGNVNASALAKDLGVEKRGNWRTTISKGVTALLTEGAPLYGEPTPEVVALALAYAKTEKANYAKSAAKAGKSAKNDSGESESDADEVVESRPLTVTDLVKSLTEAQTILGGLDADDSEEWAEALGLVDMLSDAIAEKVEAATA